MLAGPHRGYRRFANQCEAETDSHDDPEAALLARGPAARPEALGSGDPVRRVLAALIGVSVLAALVCGAQRVASGTATQGLPAALGAGLRLYPRISPCIGSGCPGRGSPQEPREFSGRQSLNATASTTAMPTSEPIRCNCSACDYTINGTVYRGFSCGSGNCSLNNTAHAGPRCNASHRCGGCGSSGCGGNASGREAAEGGKNCTGAAGCANSTAGSKHSCKDPANCTVTEDIEDGGEVANATGSVDGTGRSGITRPNSSNATESLHNTTRGRRCNNTENWTNGLSDCGFNWTGHGNYTGVGCTPTGLTCEAYEHNGWCGKDWALGEENNFPELHCCACAAAFRPSPEQMGRWARVYYDAWNDRSSETIAQAFAPDGTLEDWHGWIRGSEEVRRVSREIFEKTPNISIDVLKVYPSPGDENSAASVDLFVNMTGGGMNESFKVEDLIEFRNDGKIMSMRGSVAKITDTLSNQSSLLVKDLPPNANDLYIYKVFAPFGAIDKAHVKVDVDGTCTGVGFVKFARASDAQKAVNKVNGKKRKDGKTLKVFVETKETAEELTH